MLANQYFMSGKFQDAVPLLERTVENHPDDLRALRKLIICYVATCQTACALTKMEHLLALAPAGASDIRRSEEGCPCPRLVERWSTDPPVGLSGYDYLVSMGILQFFCGDQKALDWFRRAGMLRPDAQVGARVFDEMKHHFAAAQGR